MPFPSPDDDFVPKPYQIPHFTGSKTTEQYLEDAKNSKDAHTLFFDAKIDRSREILIFMEETKIWEDVLQDCVNRAGVNASGACAKLHQIVQERLEYYNSNFNANVRPKQTPGLPPVFERHL